MALDKKEGWIKRSKVIYSYIRQRNPSPEVRQRVFDNQVIGLYETPKTFKDGYAVNDGSWLIYNTCRTVNGTVRKKLLCKSKKDITEYVYGYFCFLRKVGIKDIDEMVYYGHCYIINKLVYLEGVFDYNKKNDEFIAHLAKEVLKKDINDIVCCREDKRKFCIDKRVKDKDKKRNNIRGKNTSDEIKKWYDSSKTVIQNLMILNKNGVKTSESTLKRWIKDQKTPKS